MTLSRSAPDDFVLAGGSVAGADHVAAFRDNQDGLAIRSAGGWRVVVVTDGCSSAPASDIGARLGALFVARAALGRLAKLPPAEAVARTGQDIVRALAAVARVIGGDAASARDVLADAFLFTWLCAAVGPETSLVFGQGDGALSINDDNRMLDPGPENAPAYAAYALFGDEHDRGRPTLHASIPTRDLRKVAIATDGAAHLLGAGGPIEALADSGRLARNASLLVKALRVARMNGTVRDDATCAAIVEAPVSAVVTVNRKRVRLTDADVLGAGGEGTVYRYGSDRAIKIFLAAPDARKLAKLAAFPPALSTLAVGPEILVADAQGTEVVGYQMRLVDGGVDFGRLATRAYREGAVPVPVVLELFKRLHAKLERIHAAGVVVGDLNSGNVLAAAGEPHLIDAESMQYARFPCEVAHERFCDPRLFGRDLSAAPLFSANSDWYAFAVLLFSSLLYVHPYGGAHPNIQTLLRRAEARASAMRPEVLLPRSAERPDVLPDGLRDWFERVFDRDQRAPFPRALLDARFTTCRCGVEHARPKCPRCAVVVAAAPPVVRRGRVKSSLVASAGSGRFRAVVVVGGVLGYVIEEGGVFRREDGTPLPLEALPGTRLHIAGPMTWATRGQDVTAMSAGRVVERFSVDVAEGEALFAATACGVVFVQGGALTRWPAMTRAGQVLSARTRLFAGHDLGFGSWDVGKVGVSFVLDLGRGPIADCTLPSPGGRVTHAAAVMDEGLVLFSREVEISGKPRSELFLIDRAGKLLASRQADADDPTFGAGVSYCMSHGRILAATSGGLALLVPDRATGRIDVSRVFPDTSDFVQAGDLIFGGPGGSVYVADPREIRLVSIDN